MEPISKSGVEIHTIPRNNSFDMKRMEVGSRVESMKCSKGRVGFKPHLFRNRLAYSMNSTNFVKSMWDFLHIDTF